MHLLNRWAFRLTSRTFTRFLFGLVSALLGGTGLSIYTNALAKTEIKVWHSMLGASEITFSELVQRFNAQQHEVQVELEYKGDPATTVNSALLAFRDKQAPELVQVQDDLAEDFLEIKGLAKPLGEVLSLVKSPDYNFFLPATLMFMKDAKGQLYGYPLTAGVPAFFYNKDAYRKAGLDPNQPPHTWRELQAQLLALKNPATGITCGYTTSDAVWIHVENLAAIHGLNIATKNNGLDGPGAQLMFNDLLHVRHMALMESWIKSLLFTYSGRGNEGDVRFASGECATLTSASTALGELLRTAKFDFGVAPLPIYDEASKTGLNSQIGGSALWVIGGKKPEQYKAVAQFLAFLSTPVIATEWHQKTGSLPLTQTVFLTSEKGGFYERQPGFAEVIRQAISKPVTRGIRLDHYNKVRDVIRTELEEVWLGDKPPKLGLDEAVRLGNIAMRGNVAETSVAKAVPKKMGSKTVSGKCAAVC